MLSSVSQHNITTAFIVGFITIIPSSICVATANSWQTDDEKFRIPIRVSRSIFSVSLSL